MRLQHPFCAAPSFCAQQTDPFRQQLGNWAFNHRGVIGACQRVQIVERQAAPWRAQQSQPRNAILRIQQRARERQRIQHFGAVLQLLQLHGAKGNRRISQSRGNRRQCGPGASQHRDAIFVSAHPRLFHALHVATNQRDNLLCLLLASFLFLLEGIRIAEFATLGLRHKLEVKRKNGIKAADSFACRFGR